MNFVTTERIINCSWIAAYSDPLSVAIQNCLTSGIIITAAVGNDQSNIDGLGTIPVVVYPAAFNFPALGKQVIATTASGIYNGSEVFADMPNSRWNYSPGTDPISDPTNSYVDFSAPGFAVKVLSMNTIDTYITGWGTSFAAPVLSGTIALMKSIYSNLTPEIAYNILKNTSEKVGSDTYNTNGWNQYMGYGRINAYKALKYLIEHYGGTFNQDVTIPSGDTWTLQPGVTLTFNNGSSLILGSYSTLTASGTSALPITFNFVSPNSTSQNGIKFTSSSMGTISYCKIRNAYQGIYESSTSINITNSAVSNCTYGIYLYNSSPTIQYCNIHDNTYAGIYTISSSSPSIKNNYIKNNSSYGIYCTTSSNPVVGDGNTAHGNNIKTNSYGIFCYNSSYPVLTTGYNNLVNTNYNIYNMSSGSVSATYNWWGTTTPANFKIAGTGSVVYGSYLSDTSNISPRPTLSKTVSGLADGNDEDIPMLSELEKAQQLINNNELSSAREVCLKLINNYPDYCVSYNALNLLKETYAKDDVENVKSIYETLFNLKEKKDIYATAGLILSDIDKENRLKHIEEVISKYEGESVIELALFDKFVYYNFETSDKENSRAVSKKLDELFPLSIGAIEAHRILGDKEYFDIYPEDQSIKKTVTTATPTEYALYDNYPNPFNPATTINFQIPKDGYVTLKVYDILGREVASLVNEERKAGRYSHNFDASKLSSGIYIYRLSSNNFTESKKMLLMK